MISEGQAKVLANEWVRRHKKCAVIEHRHISRIGNHWFIIVEYGCLRLVDLEVFDNGKVKEFWPVAWYQKVSWWLQSLYCYHKNKTGAR